MKIRTWTLVCALLVSALHLKAASLGLAFTYQGRLNDGTNPANGNYDLTFAIFSTASGGSAVAGPITNSAVVISNGLFIVPLDFGAGVFNGNSRWLEIGVRLSFVGAFTTLSPRQPITPAPYAIFAANAGAGGGSPWSLSGSNTFYNAGNVSIGTTSFSSLLTVGSSTTRGTLNVVGSSTAIPVMSLTDSRSFGRQYSFYGGLNGLGSLDVFDQTASASRLTIDSTGNVGIGTDVPQSRLQVIGDIRLGPGGQFQATSGEEKLRIIRGIINGDGTILKGTGFTVSYQGTGDYIINFNTHFADIPAVTATFYDIIAGSRFISINGAIPGGVRIKMRFDTGDPLDNPFHFIAIGPR